MRYFLLMVLIAATALAASVATAREWGDLKVRFVYGGEPPEPAKIQPNKDIEFCGQHDLIDESLLVQKDNNGIRRAKGDAPQYVELRCVPFLISFLISPF